MRRRAVRRAETEESAVPPSFSRHPDKVRSESQEPDREPMERREPAHPDSVRRETDLSLCRKRSVPEDRLENDTLRQMRRLPGCARMRGAVSHSDAVHGDARDSETRDTPPWEAEPSLKRASRTDQISERRTPSGFPVFQNNGKSAECGRGVFQTSPAIRSASRSPRCSGPR